MKQRQEPGPAPDPRLALAASLYHRKEFADVISWVLSSENVPRDERRLLLLGASYLQLGRWRQAEEVLGKLLEAYPRSVGGNLLQAIVLGSLLDYDRAIKCCDVLLEERGDLPMGHVLKGIYCEKAGRPVEAEASLERALSINPQLPGARLLLAGLNARCGDGQKAVDACISALEANPQVASMQLLLGDLHRSRGNLEAAMKAYRTALEQERPPAEAWHRIGRLHRDAGRNAEAIDAFRRAVEIDPRSAVIRCSLGRTLLDEEDAEGALEEYRVASELDPLMSAAEEGQGLALSRLGRREEAIERIECALSLDPKSDAIRASLERLRAAPGGPS